MTQKKILSMTKNPAKLAELAIQEKQLFKKIKVIRKIDYFFWKSSCSKELPASKKYIIWIITYSEEAAPSKQ